MGALTLASSPEGVVVDIGQAIDGAAGRCPRTSPTPRTLRVEAVCGSMTAPFFHTAPWTVTLALISQRNLKTLPT